MTFDPLPDLDNANVGKSGNTSFLFKLSITGSSRLREFFFMSFLYFEGLTGVDRFIKKSFTGFVIWRKAL